MALDLLLTAEHELQFLGGDFLFGDAGQDDLNLLLSHSPGSFRASPTSGANIVRLIRAVESGISDVVRAEISEPLQRDGYTSVSVRYNSQTGISISAKR